MRDSKTFLSAAALVAALVVSAVPAAAQTGRIGGTVKDQNNQPLKGATVTAENPNASPSSFTATTDDKGRYSIIGLEPGRGRSRPSAPGFQPRRAACRSAPSARRCRRLTSCSRPAPPVRPARSPA